MIPIILYFCPPTLTALPKACSPLLSKSVFIISDPTIALFPPLSASSFVKFRPNSISLLVMSISFSLIPVKRTFGLVFLSPCFISAFLVPVAEMPILAGKVNFSLNSIACLNVIGSPLFCRLPCRFPLIFSRLGRRLKELAPILEKLSLME